MQSDGRAHVHASGWRKARRYFLQLADHRLRKQGGKTNTLGAKPVVISSSSLITACSQTQADSQEARSLDTGLGEATHNSVITACSKEEAEKQEVHSSHASNNDITPAR